MQKLILFHFVGWRTNVNVIENVSK